MTTTIKNNSVVSENGFMNNISSENGVECVLKKHKPQLNELFLVYWTLQVFVQ